MSSVNSLVLKSVCSDSHQKIQLTSLWRNYFLSTSHNACEISSAKEKVKNTLLSRILQLTLKQSWLVTVGQELNIRIFSIFDELSVTDRTHFDWQIHSNPSQRWNYKQALMMRSKCLILMSCLRLSVWPCPPYPRLRRQSWLPWV